MLFSEFLEGTGCRDNDYNHRVYKDLEIMYMNSDLTKQQIYEYGKKLVDNSKTKEELELEARIKEEISEYQRDIKELKEDIARNEYMAKLESDDYWKKNYKDNAKHYRKQIRHFQNKIRTLRWVLAS